MITGTPPVHRQVSSRQARHSSRSARSRASTWTFLGRGTRFHRSPHSHPEVLGPADHQRRRTATNSHQKFRWNTQGESGPLHGEEAPEKSAPKSKCWMLATAHKKVNKRRSRMRNQQKKCGSQEWQANNRKNEEEQRKKCLQVRNY